MLSGLNIVYTAATAMSKTEEQWKVELTSEQYRILREKGTEPAFTGKYHNAHDAGMYHCAACGNVLFSSEAKFDSGTGWPSFDDPINKEQVELRPDGSYSMRRTEVLCKNCGSHLGHVFADGPTKTCQRYCINSLALNLKSK